MLSVRRLVKATVMIICCRDLVTACECPAEPRVVVCTCHPGYLPPILRAVCRRVGWDKDDCWFAHCCMLDKAERKQFADNGLGIAHCPSSNIRLGSGIAPVRRQQQRLSF